MASALSSTSLLEKLSRATGINQTTHSIFGFKLPEDPIISTFKKLGFRVAEYDLPPYPLYTAGIIGLRMLAFMLGSTVLAYFLYHYVAKRSYVLNYGCVGALAGILLLWPEVVGRSGVMLLDFWRPALGFRSALLVWDIFHIRTREEVNNWNPARFFCHLWAFPKEEQEIVERAEKEGFTRSARLQNLKGMPKVIIEGIILLVTLYFIPPAELTVGMSRFAYHAYCDTLGLSILMALALFGDGLLKSMGILCNVEMADMFENPLGTTNIRLFWSHWNRAIASVLHRVVFGGGRRVQSTGKSHKNLRVQELQAARKHYDNLSETEVETSKTDDEDDGKGNSKRARVSSLKPLTPTKPNGKTEAKDKTVNTPAGQQPPRKKGPFYPKAIAAIVTFAMSGIFHEHITRNTLGFANGENFIFFVLNGVATVVSTWFRRTYPELNAKIPTLVSVLMLHLFFFAVIPLFCSPFIRSGFFTQMDALKYELLPFAPRKRGSFIYLFGN